LSASSVVFGFFGSLIVAIVGLSRSYAFYEYGYRLDRG
jgi:hypothetical protein